jgi:hypothetical protein
MKIETKVNIYSTVFYSIVFGVLFTLASGLITNRVIDWPSFPASVLASVVASIIVGMVIPIGKCGVAVASKLAKPGTFLFTFIMYSVLMLIMLVFLCPILTLIIGCVIMGASAVAMLPSLYSFLIPFFLIGIVFLMLAGGFIMKLAMKCAGVPNEGKNS